MLIDILQITAGIATVLTGAISLFWPLRVQGFTGLEARGSRGVTEIRAILGALFIGLGGAVLYFNEPMAYQILGITYLAIAVARGVSMFADRSVEQSNVISLVTEVVIGIILVL